MRRLPIVAVTTALIAGGIAAGCGSGSEGQTTASPETVQGSVPQPTETTPTETTPVPAGDAAAGKVVFTTNCASCHILSDAGATGTVGPNLDAAKSDAARVVDRVTNGQGVMPPFAGTLTEQQIADVAAYVSTAAGS